MSTDPPSYFATRLTKVIQKPNYTSLILHTDKKDVALFVETLVGTQIQSLLLQQPSPRPTTHDLLEQIMEGFELIPQRVLIYAFEQNVYKARLILEQERHGRLTRVCDIDCRPSDAVMIALRYHTPLWIAESVLNASPDYQDEDF